MNKLLLTAFAFMAIGGAATARADFLTANAWTAPDSTTSVTGPYGDVTLNYTTPGTWTFATIAPATGLIGFDWNQTGGSYQVTFVDLALGGPVTINSTGTSGTVSPALAVNAGDIVNFTVFATSVPLSSVGAVELSNFTGAIPEPISTALLGVGLGGLGLIRRRKAT